MDAEANSRVSGRELYSLLISPFFSIMFVIEWKCVRRPGCFNELKTLKLQQSLSETLVRVYK